jgi:hypothetical protein
MYQSIMGEEHVRLNFKMIFQLIINWIFSIYLKIKINKYQSLPQQDQPLNSLEC